MQQYQVTGMSCAACSARVEKAVSSLEGVTSCNVSLLTNSMAVEGSASASEIIEAVKHAGYGASLKDAEKSSFSAENLSPEKEIHQLKNRLLASLCLLIPLMYLSMGHVMFQAPLPEFFNHNPLGIAFMQLLLSAVIMLINQKFFISGGKGLLHKAPNMDTLVAMGSGVSFLWSIIILFSMTKQPDSAMQKLHSLYFESAAMILTLITVGKLLEARSKGKTTDALKALINLAPNTALIERDGKELEIPAEQLKINDIFLLKSGQAVPVDGIVLEGHSAVNESALTGESLPVEKQKGDTVTSGTLNQSGFLRCQATRVGENTTLSQMIQLVSDASATKAPIAKTADKVSGIFVPTVLGISLLTFIVWLFIGKEFSYALTRAISVLVISCPCSLGLATPVSIMVGNGVGAKNGILFKTASSLEQAGKIQIIALDKTGTVTTGQPEVTDILSDTPDKLLEIASALEAKSEHPLAKAILRYAQEQKISIQEVSDFHSVAGNGLTAVLNQKSVSGGNFHFICSKASVPEEIQQKALAFAQEGKTAIYFTENQKLLGVIAVADKIKPDSAEAVKQFQNMGIQVVMLTGDHPQTAQAIAQQAGIQNVIADVLPDGKAKTIQELQKQGFTAMIGDGINDAPALTCADTGMAIGAGTDVAIDAADVVLMKNSLLDAVAAIRLSRATLKNIHQNLFWAFLYNSIGIPLAAGALIFLTGWELPPMFGAAAMSLSSFCVVTNALRLNLVKIKNTTHDKILKSSLAELDISNIQIERPVTEFTMKIDGMMCPHCEATVKKTLEAFPEVAQVTADFQAGTAIIQLNDILTHLEEMKQAVIDQGYEVLET